MDVILRPSAQPAPANPTPSPGHAGPTTDDLAPASGKAASALVDGAPDPAPIRVYAIPSPDEPDVYQETCDLNVRRPFRFMTLL